MRILNFLSKLYLALGKYSPYHKFTEWPIEILSGFPQSTLSIQKINKITIIHKNQINEKNLN